LNREKIGFDRNVDHLIATYYDEIYIFAYKQTLQKEVALDLTQEIFIAMLKSLSRYDRRKASFRTWLYRIAANKIIDYKRSRTNRSRIAEVDIDEVNLLHDIDYAQIADNEKLAANIETYVSECDAARQEVFRLKIYGEYTFSEIAEITGRREATVKTLYYRLIRQIRKEFPHGYTNAGSA